MRAQEPIPGDKDIFHLVPFSSRYIAVSACRIKPLPHTPGTPIGTLASGFGVLLGTVY